MAINLVQLLPIIVFPFIAVLTGIWVYRDLKNRGRDDLAPFIGIAIGGVFLAGAIPGLFALAIAQQVTTQGFPTALRIIPGATIFGAYLFFRDNISA
ncbi:MAG: hypothetical protein ABEI06_05415 [Halobacteriaceae archaeon]